MRLTTLFLVLVWAGPLTASAGEAAPSRPNIVWITTEDNSPGWLRLYDPAGAPMPHCVNATVYD